jgi:hypothetical protein
LIVGVSALTLASGCITIHRPAFMEEASEREWPATLSRAQTAATQGRFEAADSVLARFAAQHAGSPEALETAYWRALFKVDPVDRPESLTPAMALLDSYLTDPRPREHVAEAFSLRRIATQLEALSTRATSLVATIPRETRDPVSTVRPPADQRPTIDQSASDAAEIKRLKDELAKANAELERIRKRLMRPPRGA